MCDCGRTCDLMLRFPYQDSSVDPLSMSSISRRISIAWPPDIPPYENTDTLVLNFPSNHFIDLRPLKSMNALDWGMAGHQITTETSDGLKSTPPQYLLLMK